MRYFLTSMVLLLTVSAASADDFMVVNVEGEPSKAELFDEFKPGEELRLKAGSRVTVGSTSSGTWILLQGPGTFHLSERGWTTSDGPKPMVQKSRRLASGAEVTPVSGTIGGTLLRRHDGDLTLNTFGGQMTSRVPITWSCADDNRTFEVRLLEPGTDSPVWKMDTEGREVETSPLEPGLYKVHLIALSDFADTLNVFSNIRVLSAADRQTYEEYCRLLESDSQDIPTLVSAASFFKAYLFSKEAKAAARRLAELTDNPGVAKFEQGLAGD